VLVIGVWLAWALIAVLVAGVAKLMHYDELASSTMETTIWWGGSQARGRRR
jgi:hypothetical protein